jgi:molecular chaperone GrpE (heat shock protein)
MTNRPAPSLAKWPFLVGDVFLLGLAWWLVSRSPDPFAPWLLFFLVACVAGGAWLCAFPFLSEYRGAMKLLESDQLNVAVEKICHLQTVADQIAHATGQWQDIQEKAAHTNLAANGIAERMTAEAKAFADFMQKAQDTEKSHLRLEVEKLRRAEGEWLQVLVHLMDHVYALYLAGVRSGKTALINQLAGYQRATREVVRRVGLIPIEANVGQRFDENTHDLADPDQKPSGPTDVAELVATGFTYQGQLLRKPLVRLRGPEPETPPAGDLFQIHPELRSPEPAPEPPRPEEPETQSLV